MRCYLICAVNDWSNNGGSPQAGGHMIARRFSFAFLIAGALTFAVSTFAQKPASAPKKATAQCNDNTYSTAKTEQGACSRHGGVKTWWGATGAAPAPNAPASKSPSAPKTAGASPPKGATGQCTDGTYTRAKTQQGACSRHGGVETWYGANETTATSPPPAATPKSTPAPAPAPQGQPKAAPKSSAAGAPEGATAKCKDGTYSHAKGHIGACSHHGGVAEWYK